jgi:hypothetical protein
MGVMNFIKKQAGNDSAQASSCCGTVTKGVESSKEESCCGTSNDKETSCCS